MIAAMARHRHDPIAKFIRWLEDARRARIPNYEAMALATAARSGKSCSANQSSIFGILWRERAKHPRVRGFAATEGYRRVDYQEDERRDF